MRNILLSYAHFTFSWFYVAIVVVIVVTATAYTQSRDKWTECILWFEQTGGDTSNKEQLFHIELDIIYISKCSLPSMFLLYSAHHRLIMKWINYQLTQTANVRAHTNQMRREKKTTREIWYVPSRVMKEVLLFEVAAILCYISKQTHLIQYNKRRQHKYYIIWYQHF